MRQPYAGVDFIPPVKVYVFGYRLLQPDAPLNEKKNYDMSFTSHLVLFVPIIRGKRRNILSYVLTILPLFLLTRLQRLQNIGAEVLVETAVEGDVSVVKAVAILVAVLGGAGAGQAHHNHDDDEGEDEDAGDADEREDPLQHLLVAEEDGGEPGGGGGRRLRRRWTLLRVHHLSVTKARQRPEVGSAACFSCPQYTIPQLCYCSAQNAITQCFQICQCAVLNAAIADTSATHNHRKEKIKLKNKKINEALLNNLAG